jgi:hypothetical protein
MAHAITIETRVEDATVKTKPVLVCRWRCSCGYVGEWKRPVVGGTTRRTQSAARRARNGGARHVAAMERGR